MRIWIAAIATASVLATAGASMGQGTPKQDDFDACNREATSMSPVPAPKVPTGATQSGPATTTTPGVGAAKKDGMGSDRGIPASKSTDPGYRKAYTDCMRKRGFSS
jgi:hypothetical protein